MHCGFSPFSLRVGQMDGTRRTVIIGAGPAGLAAGYVLAKHGSEVCVLEADPEYVGGISRTVRYKGFYFDVGGHRFFSKSQEVENFWKEVLPDDMLERPRSSRIYYRGKFFSYPLRPLEAFLKLGPTESTRCLLSYIWTRLHPAACPISFEDWVVNQFGRRLFEIFFKTYTEKVWGMNCREISAEWAAQRIKGLSLGGAILHSLRHHSRHTDQSKVVKTLIRSFQYPRHGPGMLWEACARKIREMGGEVHLDRHVTECCYNANKDMWLLQARSRAGVTTQFMARHIISSAPLSDLVEQLSPRPSDEMFNAARRLRYRDFLTVAIILRDRGAIRDNWIYIHDPDVRVGRIQNFKSWSAEMVPDPDVTCYGLEYFCFEGDGLWSSTDNDLIRLAIKELGQIGLARQDDIVDAHVVRQRKAYPVYDAEYKQHVATIRREIESKYSRLWLVGRNGMHKYNNQDHAVMTGMLAAANILEDRPIYDLWHVNDEAEYHEEGVRGANSAVSGLRLVPRRLPKQ